MPWFRRLSLCFLFCLFSLSVGLTASANVRVLPRSIPDFALFDVRLYEVETVWVEGVKVAYANYFALRRDFPKLKKYSDEQIDALLILKFSYISVHQLDLGEVRNTTIPVDRNKTRKGFRPSAYGRADVMEFFDFDGELLGLIDRKGAGITKSKLATELKSAQELGLEKIQTKDHSDGLMTHGETLVETVREKARRQLYQIEKVDAETVETYFSMRLPFQIKKGNGQLDPAGIYGRQAHLGHMQSGFETPLPNSERSAIQMDFFGASFDQGLVRIIDPRLATTFGNFGKRVTDAQKVADWAWAHRTANSFHQEADRGSVENYLSDMTRPLDALIPEFSSERSPTLVGDLDRFFSRYGDLKNPQSRWILSHALSQFVNSELIKKYDVKEKIEVLMSDPDKKIRLRMVSGLKIFQPEQRAPLLVKLSQDSSKEVQMGLFNNVSIWSYFSLSEREMVFKKLAESSFDEIRVLATKKIAADQERARKSEQAKLQYEQSRAAQKRLFCYRIFK